MAMKWFDDNNMKANADKFQLMFLSRNDTMTDISLDICIESSTIKVSQSIDILGVEIDNKLKFNKEIDEICRQSGKQVNALKRIKHCLDKECKYVIYNSYIKSNFNYCSIVWMLTNKSHMD